VEFRFKLQSRNATNSRIHCNTNRYGEIKFQTDKESFNSSLQEVVFWHHMCWFNCEQSQRREKDCNIQKDAGNWCLKHCRVSTSFRKTVTLVGRGIKNRNTFSHFSLTHKPRIQETSRCTREERAYCIDKISLCTCCPCCAGCQHFSDCKTDCNWWGASCNIAFCNVCSRICRRSISVPII